MDRFDPRDRRFVSDGRVTILGKAVERHQNSRKTDTLKLTSESAPLREALARQILARMDAPSSKVEKALVRSAKQALEKTTGKPEAVK